MLTMNGKLGAIFTARTRLQVLRGDLPDNLAYDEYNIIIIDFGCATWRSAFAKPLTVTLGCNITTASASIIGPRTVFCANVGLSPR